MIHFLRTLLALKDVGRICESIRDDNLDDTTVKDWPLDLLQNSERAEKITYAVAISNLLEFTSLFVKAGSATLMAPQVTDSVCEAMQRFMEGSEEVQEAFSVVLERFLLSTLGNPGQQKQRATKFIAAVKSKLSDTSSWPFEISKFPSTHTPVSIGLIRIQTFLFKIDASRIGVSLHNLIYTMNSAVWRIPASHLVWCTSRNEGFSLEKVFEKNSQPENRSSNWASTIPSLLRDEFEKVEFTGDSDGYLQAKNPGLTSFIIIVAWEQNLCIEAMKACKKCLKERFKYIPDKTHGWSVDVIANKFNVLT